MNYEFKRKIVLTVKRKIELTSFKNFICQEKWLFLWLHFSPYILMILSEQEQLRRQKRQELMAMGIDPYPAAEYPVNLSLLPI